MDDAEERARGVDLVERESAPHAADWRLDYEATRANVATAIREAVAVERNRCEHLAEAESDSAAGRAILEGIRKGDSAKPAPTWSREPPAVPGWYWFRAHSASKPIVATVYQHTYPGDGRVELHVQLPGNERWYYPQSHIFAKGEWWPQPVQEPPT